MANDSERPLRCSSGSWSQTVEPSSTRPIRLIAPARCKSASARVVLPAPPWPTSATLRIFSDENGCTRVPLASIVTAGRRVSPASGACRRTAYPGPVEAPTLVDLPDGRRLAVDDVGDPGGTPVV